MIDPAAIIPSIVNRIDVIPDPPFAHRRLGSSACVILTAVLDDKSSANAREDLATPNCESGGDGLEAPKSSGQSGGKTA
jgi:hypothetical protein